MRKWEAFWTVKTAEVARVGARVKIAEVNAPQNPTYPRWVYDPERNM